MQDPTSKEEICDDCPAGWSNSNVGSSNCIRNPLGSYIQLQDGIDFFEDPVLVSIKNNVARSASTNSFA